MENAVQQTSKFVLVTSSRGAYSSHHFQFVLLCSTGRPCRILCMEILLLNSSHTSSYHVLLIELLTMIPLPYDVLLISG